MDTATFISRKRALRVYINTSYGLSSARSTRTRPSPTPTSGLEPSQTCRPLNGWRLVLALGLWLTAAYGSLGLIVWGIMRAADAVRLI